MYLHMTTDLYLATEDQLEITIHLFLILFIRLFGFLSIYRF